MRLAVLEPLSNSGRNPVRWVTGVNVYRILEVPRGHMKPLRIIPIVFILAGVALLFQRPAYGYTDPGTGLLAVQAAGSALIATGWYLRRKIYNLLHRNQPAVDEPERLPAAADGKDQPRQ